MDSFMAILFHREMEDNPDRGDDRPSRIRVALGRLRRTLFPNRWLSFYPNSLTQLISGGLLILVLLLVTALGIAGLYLEKATSKGQQAVTFSTQAVQYSLALSDLVKDMERSARVYQVLNNNSLLASYSQFRRRFELTAKNLAGLEYTAAIKSQLDTLLTKERQAFAVFATAKPGTVRASEAIELFSEMRDLAAALIAYNSQAIETRVNEMKETAATTRRALFWEAIIAIGFVVVVAVWVIPPLSRYIRDLDQSIVQIGHGNLDKEISLKGPRDIRELGARLEWLRRQLDLLETQKQHFLRHFSHELKTPLASLREGASLLAEEVAGSLNDEQKEIAAILQRNCVSLQQQIDSLLKYSVSMQPFQTYEYQAVRLDEQILGVTREHKLQIRAKELSVRTELEAVTVYEDQGQITTVIDNLVSNAVKFSPHGGHIEILLFQDGKNAVLEVADDGPGIPSEEKPLVFDAFYKSRNSDNDHIEGSGLGLSIAKHYASAHGGDIEIIDGDKGARLRLTLPLPAKRLR